MYLAELSSPKLASLSRSTPIVFPIAAIEQHGPHMPLATDSLLLGEVVRRSEALLSDRVIFAPLQWLGNSDHHLDFPGTLSAPPRVYLDLLNGLAENVLRHGFQRLVFLNGHGGNDVPGRQAVFELRQRYRNRTDLMLLMATYWNLAQHGLDQSMVQTEMGHACEWETSMMMRLAPHLVGEVSDLPSVTLCTPFQPAHRGWVTQERSVAGYIGEPKFATAEKGERLFEGFTAGTHSLLERVLRWDGASWHE